MARALRGDAQAVLAGEGQRGGHVAGVLGEHDSGGVLVGGEVPGHAGGVPGRVAGDDRVAGETLTEGVDVEGGGFGGHRVTVVRPYCGAMPGAELDALRRALDAFNRRDYAAWVAECDPAFTNVPPRDWPESAPAAGAAAVWDVLTEATFELSQATVVGDRLVGLIASQVQGRASGATVPWRFWAVVTFRDGRALRVEWYADREEALQVARATR